MSYSKTQWVNGQEPPINASNLNKIETGISNNDSAITNLQGGMKFKGTTTVIPASPKVGDVYQAAVANIISHNKPGDLLVYTDTNSWHVIPSGDEANGTVTEIYQGEGIIVNNGDSLRETGNIKLDTDYIATDDRNGLMPSAHFRKLRTLANIAVTGSWNDLQDIAESAIRPIWDDVDDRPGQNPRKAVVSQYGIKNLLETKSNVIHEHLIDDIKASETPGGPTYPLANFLATKVEGGREVLVKAADENHTHGIITKNGYASDGNGYSRNSILTTDNAGKIICTSTLPSTITRGYQFYNSDGTASIDISDLNSRITANYDEIQNLKDTKADTSAIPTVPDPVDLSGINSKLAKLKFATTGSEANDVHRFEFTIPANSILSKVGDDALKLGRRSELNNATKYPIAIRGWNISNRPNGSGGYDGKNGQYCNIFAIYFSSKTNSSGGKDYYANIQMRNNASTSAVIWLTLYILWKEL